MRLALVALAVAAAVLLVPIIAIAQAISYGWGYVFNTAYMGVQRAMWSYGMPGSVPGMGGMMGWGSSYMGRMASMGGMMGHGYGQINISGVFLVGRDVEDMEHMAILIDASGRQYALILPAEEWILVAPNGSKTVIDLEDLRSALNSTRVTITGINIGSMAEMHSMMGMMWGMMGSPQMCHSPQGSASTPPMPGMGMDMGSPPHSSEGEEHEEHDHMEACARLMALTHVVVSSISFNGYTAMPSS